MQKIILGVGAFLSLLGCASVEPNQDIFKQPGEALGTEVTVTGYLKYGFENRNLFPSPKWKRDWLRGKCLPIGIDAGDERLIALAERLDGHRVEVRGAIETLVSENEITSSFCKDVGLLVRELRDTN